MMKLYTRRIKFFSVVCFFIIGWLYFLMRCDSVTPSSSSASMKFYLVPVCPYEYNEINKNTITFYNRLVSLKSYQTNINDADYCLTSYSCIRSADIKANLEYYCKKIVVLNLQPYASKIKSLDSNSKYHLLYSNCRYVRKDKDVCAPLFAKANCQPNDYNRQYSVSFKGTIYNSDEGMFRYTIKWLNQTPNSFIHFSCNQPTNIMNMYNNSVKSVSLDKECDQFNSSYFLSKDYCSTLNASFVLTPGGRQPSSYRFYDALSVGAIPIPYYDRHDIDVPFPFHRSIDWAKCTKVFTEIYEVERLVLTDQVGVRRLIDNCREIYNSHFSTMENIVKSLNKELSIVFNNAIC